MVYNTHISKSLNSTKNSQKLNLTSKNSNSKNPHTKAITCAPWKTSFKFFNYLQVCFTNDNSLVFSILIQAKNRRSSWHRRPIWPFFKSIIGEFLWAFMECYMSLESAEFGLYFCVKKTGFLLTVELEKWKSKIFHKIKNSEIFGKIFSYCKKPSKITHFKTTFYCKKATDVGCNYARKKPNWTVGVIAKNRDYSRFCAPRSMVR